MGGFMGVALSFVGCSPRYIRLLDWQGRFRVFVELEDVCQMMHLLVVMARRKPIAGVGGILIFARGEQHATYT